MEATTNEEAAQKILNWINSPEFNLDRPLFEREYEKLVLAKSAAIEIIDYILDRPWQSPSDSVYEFELNMLQGVCNATRKRTKRLFLISADTADAILALL